jgi:hypothetical protein
MTFRINFRRAWKDPLHPAWIILAILELGILIEAFNQFVLHSPSLRGLIVWAKPPALEFFVQDLNRALWGSYVVAGGIRVSEGIGAFSGKPITGAWDTGHTMVMISMLLSYIIGPVLLLWGLNARKKWMREKHAKPSPLSILITTTLGGYIVAFALLVPTLSSLISWNSWQRMKADTRVNAIRDGAISSISALGFQAQLLRWMPGTKGGGPWMENPGGITVADLQVVLPSMEKSLWQPGARSSMKYCLEITSPDSLTLWGIADVQGMNSGGIFRNRDSSSGNVQVRVGVTSSQLTTVVEN